MKFGYFFLIFLSLACRPDRFAGFVDSGEFKALQRTTLEVPNSTGLLKLSLGDISFERVPIKLVTSDGQVVVSVVLREGDLADFSLSGRSYRINLIDMNNYLIGADDVILRIRKNETTTGQPESLDKNIRTLVASFAELKRREILEKRNDLYSRASDPAFARKI